MKIDLSDDDPVDVQMTPLIDCVFLLLIFFLVATVIKKTEQELPVELPQSAAALKVPQSDETLVIGIDRDGTYYLGATPVTMELLHTRLRETAKTDITQRIRIDGDRDAPFQSFVHLMDLCQFEGLKNVGVRSKSQGK